MTDEELEVLGWVKVMEAGDCIPCECCQELVCTVCQVHYWECGCPGPTQDEYDYQEVNGVLWAKEI